MNKLTIDITGLVQKITEAKKNMVGNALTIGKCLSDIAVNDLWKEYGSHLENFDDFLKEIVIPKSTGHHYMRVWDTFGEYLMANGLALPIRRLIKLLPIATEENKEELLHKAEILSDADFSKEIAEEKGIIDCQHPEDQRQYFYQCKVCKQWVKLDKAFLKFYFDAKRSEQRKEDFLIDKPNEKE